MQRPAQTLSCSPDCCHGDDQPRRRGWRSRWAAIGAAIAVVAGLGGVSWAGATNAEIVPSSTAISPCRIMDTRPANQVGPRGTALASGTTHTISVTGKNGNCIIPSDTASVFLNLTVVSPGSSGYITVFPGGTIRPGASNLNYSAGQAPVANLVNAALGSTGQLSFFASGGPVHLIADITGYTTKSRLTTNDLAQVRWHRDQGRPATVPVGPGPQGITFDGSNIWVAVTGTGQGNGELAKIDPTSQAVLATVPVGGQPRGLASDGRYVWVANVGSSTVQRVDPTTNSVTATISVPSGPTALVYDGTNIWAAGYTGGKLVRINASTLAAFPFDAAGVGVRALAFDGTYVWAACELCDSVVRYDPATANADGGLTIGAPFGLAFDGESMWVTSETTGSVLQVDATSLAVLRSIPTGDLPRGVTYDGSSVWVTNYGTNDVTKIDPTTGEVKARIAVGTGPRWSTFDGTSVWVTNGSSSSASKIRSR